MVIIRVNQLVSTVYSMYVPKYRIRSILFYMVFLFTIHRCGGTVSYYCQDLFLGNNAQSLSQSHILVLYSIFKRKEAFLLHEASVDNHLSSMDVHYWFIHSLIKAVAYTAQRMCHSFQLFPCCPDLTFISCVYH